jgi:energy-coupling factor transporter ATP-binding protein EcfA2
MGDLTTDVRVFLSSTFTDLRDLRQEIVSRLRQVFGAQFIIMETFGSDEAPPEISSVRRVRECDVFVAVYARRYGTVDYATGKSITELELDEAERALSAGNIIGILIYLLDDGAPWPIRYCDTDPTTVEKLSRLKEHARLHTITKFSDQEDLPFLVIRDVLSKIRRRLSAVSSARRRPSALPDERKLDRPVGMEFLTSADRQHLYGRGRKIMELLGRISSNQITLLLGNSGSGKTSLIHAGLIPAAIENGWLPVYTRPLGLPRSDIATALLASVFEGTPSYRGSLVTPLEQAIAAINPLRLLLIIDQFEDVLTAKDQEETERLVADLRTVRHLVDSSMRVLVSYRADLEARLGRFWQSISGSPEGLARVYIPGISAADAWKSIEGTCKELQIKLDLAEAEEVQAKEDLLSFSARHGEEGVYPPYIQMFIDHVWRKARSKSECYQFEDYLAAGGMEGVTGGYLTRQLVYAQDTEGRIRAVLASLVRSYGVKAQKSLGEIASDVGMTEHECELLLERVIDLRLVRHIRDLYEVAHDFLAHEISSKLIDLEEREFKRFRELLTSKAAAFTTTRSLLSVEELLLLYKHKERVLPSDGELRLILASWAREEGPGLYWILSEPSSRVLELVRAEEAEEDIADEDRAMLALLRRKVGGTRLQGKDWSLFRSYRLGVEMAALLLAEPLECPDKALTWALRSKHRSVRAAAFEAVAKKVASGHRKWIADLWKSSSPFKRTTYEMLSLREDLPLLPDRSSPNTRRPFQEFALLQRIARSQSTSQMRAFLKVLREFRPKARTSLFAKGMAMQRIKGMRPILKKLPKLGTTKSAILLSSARGKLGDGDFGALLKAYLHWNEKEAAHSEVLSRRRRAFYEDKANALAEAMLRVATKRNLGQLRHTFQTITLTPSAQYYAITLLRLGKTRDVLNIIKKVERAPHDIRYWFQIEMGHAIERRMTELGGPIPAALLRIQTKKAFWEDPRGQRSRFSPRDLLPLARRDNRALYLRIVAHAIIGAAQKENIDLLKKLAQHTYRMIARAAAIRLTRLAEDDGIRMLQSAITEAIDQRNAGSFAVALRDAEIQRFGLADLW